MRAAAVTAAALAKSLLAAAAGLSAAAAILPASPASAQTQPEIPEAVSPLRVETDHNGVNLVTGRTTIDVPVLAVPAAPNLRFDRVQNAAPYMTGNISGGPGQTVAGSYTVHTGSGSSESFTCTDYDCTSVTGTGSLLQPTEAGPGFYRQAGSGALWTFNLKHADEPGTTSRFVQYYGSKVEYPNGEVVTYSYGTALYNNRTFYRPTRVSSNVGYRIDISYHAGSFPNATWSQAQRAALSTNGGTLIREMTYSAGGGTITEAGDGMSRTYNCTGCTNQLGVELEVYSGSLTLPGEAVPTLQVAQTTQTVTTSSGGTVTALVVGAVTRDGVTWNYSYANLRFAEGAPGYWYDGITVTGPQGYRRVYAISRSDKRNVIASLTENVTATTTRTTHYQFDQSYRPTRITYPEGNQVSVGYDELGNVISRTLTPKPGSGASTIIETATYPPETCDTLSSALCWRPVSHTDALGRVTNFEYNSHGQLTVRRDPADEAGVRRRTTIDYGTQSIPRRPQEVRVCGTGAPCGTASEIVTQYDYFGGTSLPDVERRISGSTTLQTVTTYDPSGRPTRINGPLPGPDDALHRRYDGFGRLTWDIGPFGANGAHIVQRHTYRNSDDRITRTDTGTIPTSDSTSLTVRRRVDYGYDPRRNRILEELWASGTTYAVLQRSFDLRSRLTCEARRMDPASFGALPASACTVGPVSAQYGSDRIARYLYDDAGQLLVEQRAYGRPAQQNYATYTYTPNGQRATVVDANGNRAELRYDGHDRLARWVFPSPTVIGALNENDYESYGYDAASNRTSLRRRNGAVLTYQYDALGRMTRKTVPERSDLGSTHTRDVFYAYDVRDLTTHARFDSHSGEGIVNQYDGFGRLTSSTTSMDGRSRRLEHLYDEGGRRIRLTWPGSQAATYSWDAAGRLTGLYQGAGTTNPFATWTYNIRGLPTARAEQGGSSAGWTWDPVERLSGRTHTFTDATGNSNATFAYNPASQIVTMTRTNDAYAWAGPEVARGYEPNGLNQYAQVGAANYSYDANGNLTSDGVRTFKYDNENRLVSRTGAAGGTTTLRYDPLGRLHEVAGTQATTEFLWDGDALVSEYDNAGTLLRRYAHGGQEGVDDPLVWTEAGGGGTHRLLHSDHQGSIIAIAEPDGSSHAINAYDAWGLPRDPVVGRFGYTGQIWLPEIGLYHYKARMYSPELGRFMQTDPIGYEGGINLYAYVGNDPLNQFDPSGECPTGTLLGESAFCRVHMDYAEVELARVHRPRGRGRVPNTPGGNHQQNIEARINRLEEQLQVLSPGASGISNPSGQRTMTAVRTLEQQVSLLQRAPLRNNAEARAVARAMGFREVPGIRSRGQPVFTNGRHYITRDIPSRTTQTTHSGGVWKMAATPSALNSRTTRLGTYNRDLTAQVGDQ